MTKEDVLLPQDAQAVDPSKLSALTPEVVSFVRRKGGGKTGFMPEGRNGLWAQSSGWKWGARWDDGGRYRRFQGYRDLRVFNEVWLCIGSALLQARHILCQFWTEIFGRKVMSSVPRKK